jgi:two-component system cell cycle sensor histidine kinase PleC
MSTDEPPVSQGGEVAEPFAAALIEAYPDAVIITDRQWRPVVWNRRFAELWQLGAAAGARATWRRIRRQLPQTRTMLAAGRAAAKGVYCSKLLLLDGREIEIRGAPFLPSDPLSPLRVWFCRDVTLHLRQQHHLAAALARAEAAEAEATGAQHQLEDAIESLSDGFALFDPSGRLVLANCWLRDVHAGIDSAFALVPGTAYTAAMRNLLAGSSLDSIEDFVARRVEEFGQGGGAWEVQLANGRWLYGTERRMRDGGMVAVRRDITLLKRREEQLRAAMIEATTANKAKSDFLANMSHELRTPLNAIIGFSEMIGSEVFGSIGNARYAGYIGDIHASGQHLLNIINTVLDLARVEAGKIVLNDGIVDLDQLIGDCASLMRERCARAGLRLKLEIEPDLPVLRADPMRLKQVVLNLLSNAIKFTRPHGQVAIRARSGAGGSVEIEIADTGIGIEPRNLPHVFEPFGLTHAAYNRSHEGTGLGLPLSKALIDEHGGQLLLTSTLGIGTVVTIRMPPERVIRPSVDRDAASRSGG